VQPPLPLRGDLEGSFANMLTSNTTTSHTRARGWVFTINNWLPSHEELLRTLDSQYIVWGREVGERGTPHLQGYVFFKNAKTRSQVSRLIPGAYLDLRKGTHEQARAYAIKDGLFEEHGDRPMDASERSSKGGAATSAKWKSIAERAKLGDLDWIRENNPKEYVLHKPRLESLYAPNTAPLDGNLLHEWWVGPTGTGKSRALWDLYPQHFAKAINKWWDGYRFEEVVAIEEWSPENIVTANALKRWADRYPFTGEIKGGTIQRLRPRKIIVLSNYTMEQCFTRTEDLEPLKRRFKVIKFPEEAQRVNFRAAWFNNPPEETTDFDMTSASSVNEDGDEDLLLPDLDIDGLFSQE